MTDMGQEIRHATRRLLRAPAFTVAAVATLALAIGANTSIFAVVERVVLNPLPFPDSDRLILVEHAGRVRMSAETYRHYAARARTLERLAIWDDTEVTLTGDGDAERLRIVRVTPSLGEVLRVAPAHGRWLIESDAARGARPVAVLSHGLWMRRYGGDTAIIGRAITVNSVAMDVIGIMPPDFVYPASDVQMWINDERLDQLAGAGLVTHVGVARLRDGVTIDDARAELTRLIPDLPRAYPNAPRVVRLAESLKMAAPVSLKAATIGNVARALWILLASVAVVLLVACANVANLFLARSESRRAEVAVRRALGAGERGIARYVMTESSIVSLAGGVAGLALAWGGLRFLVASAPDTLPRLHEVRLGGFAVAFTLALSVVAGLVLGGISFVRRPPVTLLLRVTGTFVPSSRFPARQVLMGVQIALALMLLTSSGLMVRSFQNLRSVDPGFDASSTLTFRLGVPPDTYPDHARIVAAHRQIREQLAALTGVVAVGASNCLPLETVRCLNSSVRVAGRLEAPGTARPGVFLQGITAGFFESSGMRMLRGRPIEASDFDTRQLVVVINQALADAYFPGENPIGQRVTPASDDVWGTIVGIVANTSTFALNEPSPVPKLYMPMSVTDPAGLGGPNPTNVSYVVRTSLPPLSLLPSVRGAIGSVDRDVPITDARTLQDVLDRASAQMTFMMVLLAVAAAATVTLGVVGIYGAMSYIVSQRTSEIGIRVAVGARPAAVAGLIVRQGGLVAVVGIAVGLGVALASGRFIESVLFDVSPRDPAVFAATTLLLLGVAVLACWIPARRAARLDPVQTLRAG
jgi:putative ABC transport system permease protein